MEGSGGVWGGGGGLKLTAACLNFDHVQLHAYASEQHNTPQDGDSITSRKSRQEPESDQRSEVTSGQIAHSHSHLTDVLHILS